MNTGSFIKIKESLIFENLKSSPRLNKVNLDWDHELNTQHEQQGYQGEAFFNFMQIFIYKVIILTLLSNSNNFWAISPKQCIFGKKDTLMTPPKKKKIG